MANITRYNPFNEGVSLREAMNNLFEDSFIPRLGFAGRGMASNLYETAESFVLQLPMPGVNPEDVEITAEPNVLLFSRRTVHVRPAYVMPACCSM
jgi:HSP20 family protein